MEPIKHWLLRLLQGEGTLTLVVYFIVSYYDYCSQGVCSLIRYVHRKDASINEEVEKLRHQATTSLLSRRDVIVVASVSCIYGIGSLKIMQVIM